MNAQLGKEITRLMARSKLTVPELARRTGLGQSWLKAVKTGRIARPNADGLRRIATETGGDADSLLALSSQLGAAKSSSQPTDLAALAAAISELAEELRLTRQERGVIEERLRSLEAAAKLQAQSTGGVPRGRSAPRKTTG